LERPRRSPAVALILLAVLGAAAGAWSLLGRRAPAGSARPPAAVERGHVVVEVLNASGRRGLARVATRVLRQAGFDVVFFGNSGDSLRTSEVLARRGDSSAAARVARAIGAARVRVARDTLLRVDVTVRLGDDYRAPEGVRP
jgi:LytR cell envelope-related transcriptional attenuator